MKLNPDFFIVYDLVITKFACVFNFCNTTLNDKIELYFHGWVRERRVVFDLPNIIKLYFIKSP